MCNYKPELVVSPIFGKFSIITKNNVYAMILLTFKHTRTLKVSVCVKYKL